MRYYVRFVSVRFLVPKDYKNVVFISFGEVEEDLEEWLDHMWLGQRKVFTPSSFSELRRDLGELLEKEWVNTGIFILSEELGSKALRKCGLTIDFPPGTAILFTGDGDRHISYPPDEEQAVELLCAAK